MLDWAFSSMPLKVVASSAISSLPSTSAGVVTGTTSIERSPSWAARVNAVLAPLALDGPLLTIRRFPKDPLEVPGPRRPRDAHARTG